MVAKRRVRARRAGIVLVLLALLAGCGPEAGRARSGGAGADVGNHARPEIPASKVWNTNEP
ncbi:MAG TPA: hypothetical protein VEZ12_16590 [Herpetosiphonaceae bacterium]|nr:hypothetical protein [Herpetosiphonaceae bacterium]